MNNEDRNVISIVWGKKEDSTSIHIFGLEDAPEKVKVMTAESILRDLGLFIHIDHIGKK